MYLYRRYPDPVWIDIDSNRIILGRHKTRTIRPGNSVSMARLYILKNTEMRWYRCYLEN